MIPIVIMTRKPLFRKYGGFSFFIFIFCWKDAQQKAILLNHETIHFWQQVELVFIFHWILYAVFYVMGRARGKNHDQAYLENPFEREAYRFEKDLTYCKHRRPFRWAVLSNTDV